MNKVILMGRLVRDADVRYSQTANGQMAIARYTLAVDKRYKKDGEQNADFITCVAFGKAAEFIEKYCHKGTKLVIEGRIQTGSYTNKEGNKVYTTEVMIEHQEFAESKASSGNQGNTGGSQPQVDSNGFMNIDDDLGDEGLPFN